MLYRRYDFTTPEVLEAIKNFVPVAVEARSWQGSFPDREKYFPGFLDRTGLHLFEPEGTHGINSLVGLFGFRPDGTLLKEGLVNSETTTGSSSSLRYLNELLLLWNEVPAEERGFPGLDRTFPNPGSYWGPAAQAPGVGPNCDTPDCSLSLESALVLKSFTRDLPRDKDQPSEAGVPRRKDFFKDTSNSDFLLVRDPEVLVPQVPVVGSTHKWPEWLVTRLVRFHLVDNVGGLTMAFPVDAVREAKVVSLVTRVTDQAIEMDIVGVTRATTRSPWGLSQSRPNELVEVGFATEIRGQARWLRQEKLFDEFRLTAIGNRWGGTPQNRRAELEFLPHTNDLSGGPIGVHFRLFEGAEQDIVAPFFTWEGRGDPADYWSRGPR